MNQKIDADVREMLLDDENLCKFMLQLSSSKGKTVKLDSIWEVFCSTYSDFPSGRERRVWLSTVLNELDGSEEIALPVAHGKQWDRTSDVPLPTKISLKSSDKPTSDTDWQSFAWNRKLGWVSERKYVAPTQVEFLYRVNRGLAEGWFEGLETLKYRSLQLTGDEKRLVRFSKTKLFGASRLSFEMLGCDLEMLPIAFERISNQSNMLIFENAAPFIAARTVARELADSNVPFRFGVIAYGAGKQVVKSAKYLSTFRPQVTSVLYVGDLDAEGVQIAADLQRLSVGVPVKPATKFHQAMLDSAIALGHADGWLTLTKQKATLSQAALRFMEVSIRQRCVSIIGTGQRIPEEALSYTQISSLLRNDAVCSD